MSADTRFRSLDAGFDQATIEARLDRVLRVVIGPEQATWERQLLAICLVDLLARLSPRIQIDCEPELAADPALPPGPDTLLGRLEQARSHALLEPRSPDEEPVITIALGSSGGVGADIYVDGCGWLSFLGTSPPVELRPEEANPLGPLIAACRAAAAATALLLAEAIHAAPLPEASYWSAATLRAMDPAEVTGPALSGARLNALLMGAGSIGGATVYALARVSELAGDLVLLDPDSLEEHNSRKALLARRTEIESGAPKINVAVAELAHLGNLKAPLAEQTLAEWVAAGRADRPLPLVLCAVDSLDARRELADHMPLDVINAACGGRDLRISGHRTDEGPCVYCLYLPDRLDVEQSRQRMIVRETGFEPRYVVELRNQKAQLSALHLRQIEDHLKKPRGTLPRSPRVTLDELFDRHLLYGEAQVADEQGRRGTLTLPFVPALAGFLLAAEALKRSLDPPRLDLALGPNSGLTEYSEDLFDFTAGCLATYPRVEGSACLCRSRRRLQLMRERYRFA